MSPPKEGHLSHTGHIGGTYKPDYTECHSQNGTQGIFPCEVTGSLALDRNRTSVSSCSGMTSEIWLQWIARGASKLGYTTEDRLHCFG
jgi:hypothetical protein